MCANNLATWQRLDQGLNSRPLESQANALTITPPGYIATGMEENGQAVNVLN